MRPRLLTSLQEGVSDCVCPSVGPLVRRSVGWSVGNHFAFLGVNSWKEIRFELLPLPNYFTAPAHPHATDAAVYMALFYQKYNGSLEQKHWNTINWGDLEQLGAIGTAGLSQDMLSETQITSRHQTICLLRSMQTPSQYHFIQKNNGDWTKTKWKQINQIKFWNRAWFMNSNRSSTTTQLSEQCSQQACLY